MSLLAIVWLALAGPTPPPSAPPLVASPGQAWGVVGARTAGQGSNEIEAGLGWPGVHVSYLRGLTPSLDLGVRVGLNYAYEGAFVSPLTGFRGQFLLHYKLYDAAQVSVALLFEPGPLFYFFPVGGCYFDTFGNRICGGTNNVLTGFTFPVGIRLGLAASSAINVGVSFEVPVWLNFGRVNSVQLPVLIGAGLEYFVRSNLLLYASLKMGPTLYTSGAPAAFTLDAKVGVGFRF